ncbi:hypothetical protein [Notoacmeibacter ruber]|uniref:DUF2336 domain-containing protein n=1 Tax=Notoacmeibacter ruber TaxID=2670375 RepID=A0A3L7JAQ7_9HYPH|nr:hypothetical protein [Notoacmeibacter ruber]RLQ87524.1 hypothetical protein D8780_04185 [Notoacmeibacter ruber]
MPQSVLRSRLVVDRNSEARPDAVFRHAVGTFAALTRPSGYEVRQLEALGLALFPRTSEDARRYAAAVLSDRTRAPRGLLLKLALEPVAISAPLLMRTPVFSTRDWLHIVKNTDIDHARVIGRRGELPSAVRAILTHLKRKHSLPAQEPTPATTEPNTQSLSSRSKTSMPKTLKEVQMQLRAAMAGNSGHHGASTTRDQGVITKPSTLLAKLRETALSGDVELFATALADALAIELPVANDIVHSNGTHEILMALRALSLTAAEAHLIVRAVRPDTLTTTASICLFIERFEALTATQADDKLRNWREQSVLAVAESTAAKLATDSLSHDEWDDREPVDFETLSGGNDAMPRLRAVG